MSKSLSVNVVIEGCNGEQITDKEILAKIKEKWQADGNKVKDIDSLNIYPNVADNKAYYVINGTIEDYIPLF